MGSLARESLSILCNRSSMKRLPLSCSQPYPNGSCQKTLFRKLNVDLISKLWKNSKAGYQTSCWVTINFGMKIFREVRWEFSSHRTIPHSVYTFSELTRSSICRGALERQSSTWGEPFHGRKGPKSIQTTAMFFQYSSLQNFLDCHFRESIQYRKKDWGVNI